MKKYLPLMVSISVIVTIYLYIFSIEYRFKHRIATPDRGCIIETANAGEIRISDPNVDGAVLIITCPKGVMHIK